MNFRPISYISPNDCSVCLDFHPHTISPSVLDNQPVFFIDLSSTPFSGKNLFVLQFCPLDKVSDTAVRHENIGILPFAPIERGSCSSGSGMVSGSLPENMISANRNSDVLFSFAHKNRASLSDNVPLSIRPAASCFSMNRPLISLWRLPFASRIAILYASHRAPSSNNPIAFQIGGAGCVRECCRLAYDALQELCNLDQV